MNRGLRFGIGVLLAVWLLHGELHAQTKDELYRLNFLQYEQYGNSPIKVDEFWVRLGRGASRYLKQRPESFDVDVDPLINSLEKLYSDPNQRRNATAEETADLADKTFGLLAEAGLAEQLVLEHVAKRLKSYCQNERRKAKGQDIFLEQLRQFLTRHEIQLMLGIGPEQDEKIRSAIERSRNEYRQAISVPEAHLRAASDEMYSQMLDLLTPQQRARTLYVCGDPVWQVFEFDAPFYAEKMMPWMSPSTTQGVFYGTKVDVSPDDRGLLPHQLSNRKLTERGYEKFDKFVVNLFQSDFCRKTLELNEEQTAKLPAIDKHIAEFGIAFEQESRQRVLTPLRGISIFPQSYRHIPEDPKLPKILQELLNQDQADKFRRLAFQARIIRMHRGVMDVQRFVSVTKELDKRTKLALQSLIETSGVSWVDAFRQPKKSAYVVTQYDHRMGKLGTRFIRNQIKQVLDERNRVSTALNEELKQILQPEQLDGLLDTLGYPRQRQKID